MGVSCDTKINIYIYIYIYICIYICIYIVDSINLIPIAYIMLLVHAVLSNTYREQTIHFYNFVTRYILLID